LGTTGAGAAAGLLWFWSTAWRSSLFGGRTSPVKAPVISTPPPKPSAMVTTTVPTPAKKDEVLKFMTASASLRRQR
jgi:hypothetical protein